MEDKWQELRDLEAQRSDIVTKLQRIEEKKSTVSHEVYEKVKLEYEEKLKTLDGKMTQYVDLIKEELARIKEEEAQLKEEERAVNLKAEELELRYSIGEYDEEAYKDSDSESTTQLSDIQAKIEKLHERQKWLSDFADLKEVEVPTVEPPAESEMKIEEHILEKKLPEEEVKLDELLVEEEAVRPEAGEQTAAPPVEEKPAEAPPEPPKKSSAPEKNVPCPKCGAMNAPDSWYCEKCGAEILDSPAQ